MDFGISGSDTNIVVEYTNAGSIRYIAPEVITSHKPAHPGIDIWAMGCILYQLLTGEPTFNQDTKP